MKKKRPDKPKPILVDRYFWLAVFFLFICLIYVGFIGHGSISYSKIENIVKSIKAEEVKVLPPLDKEEYDSRIKQLANVAIVPPKIDPNTGQPIPEVEDESAMTWALIFYGICDLITFYLGYYLGGL